MEEFSIIVTCVNETIALKKTIDILFNENDKRIKEVILVYPDRVTKKTLGIINDYCKTNHKIKKLKQNKPHVGGAVQDAFDVVEGKYTIMMAGDLETDPYDVKRIVKSFEDDNDLDVVTASRWIIKDSFSGYGKMRVLYNYIFNKIFAILYGTKLTDMTFGYRGFKTSIIKQIEWSNMKHSFFFETIIKPINMGCKISEISTKWVARDDGDPQIERDYYKFIIIGLKGVFKI